MGYPWEIYYSANEQQTRAANQFAIQSQIHQQTKQTNQPKIQPGKYSWGLLPTTAKTPAKQTHLKAHYPPILI